MASFSADHSPQASIERLTAPDALTVLHVDDDPGFADLVATYLERESDSMEVLTETSAVDGIERLGRADVDCVVSDYDLPRTDGLEFLDAVREEHPELPFILYTGKGSEEIASEAISAGVTDYLQKGGGTDQYAVLANRVRNAVEQHRATREVERGFQAIETAREGISFLDEDGKFLYVNPAYADAYGYDREELIGEHWKVLYPDDGVEQVYDEILPSVPADGKWTGESVHRRKDGTELIVSHALAYCSEGTLLCFIQDVSEAKAMERTLERQRRHFEQFVDAVEEYAIFALDTEGRVTSWNRGAERLKGYSADEIVGEHLSTFYPDAKAEQGYPEELLATAREEGSVEDEGWRVRKDGSTFWANVVITAVCDDNGCHQGFLKVTRDLTDRRRRGADDGDVLAADDGIDDRLLERAIDEVPVGITISGPPSDDVPLVYANEAFVRLTGYSREEILGHNCRFLQGEATRPEPVRELAAAIEAGAGTTVELRNYRKDGTEFWNRVSITPIRDDAGDVTNYVGFQQDVTDRKRLERQLDRQLAQFEHFGGVLSHDFRTPLTTVRGRLQLARETGDTDHLDQATAALDRLEELVDNLSSAMRKGELVDEPTAVGLGDCLRSVWETLETGDATLRIETDGSIRADAEALKRLVENLFANALEHAGAEVTVTAGALADGFYVEDDGPGIPIDDRNRVFEAGYSTREGSHGFGLASVKQLAVAHGWDITATDGSDGGARFEITDAEVERQVG
ncbi:PAS domain S-box protein [Natronoarchaeum mannanilyticum]|uniref:PAS domain S-box-containing protein n=1 Tax=Natronoarchaeum mannanilyticum TaxID=926360 RepID=A0AAV3T6G6_9EURY